MRRRHSCSESCWMGSFSFMTHTLTFLQMKKLVPLQAVILLCMPLRWASSVTITEVHPTVSDDESGRVSSPSRQCSKQIELSFLLVFDVRFLSSAGARLVEPGYTFEAPVSLRTQVPRALLTCSVPP